MCLEIVSVTLGNIMQVMIVLKALKRNVFGNVMEVISRSKLVNQLISSSLLHKSQRNHTDEPIHFAVD